MTDELFETMTGPEQAGVLMGVRHALGVLERDGLLLSGQAAVLRTERLRLLAVLDGRLAAAG